MAAQTIWYYTGLPKKVVDSIEEDLENNFDSELQDSIVGHNPQGEQSGGNELNKNIRNAKNTWVPTSHWLGGFCWHYVNRSNNENFLYDLNHIDNESLQYTVYYEGHYYNWHTDAGLDSHYTPLPNFESSANTIQQVAEYLVRKKTEKVRKLSFSLLLSDPDTYQGGNLELKEDNGKTYIAPRQRGTIILFDSRALHRVTKVTKGVRKSVVGWTVGPRWK